MPIINFVNEKKQVQAASGANLRKEARKAGVQLYNGINGWFAGLNKVANCHGLGFCGTCRVLITKGLENTSPMGLQEKANFRAGPAMIAYIGNEPKMRLACCTKVQGDIDVVTRPEFNITGENFFS